MLALGTTVTFHPADFAKRIGAGKSPRWLLACRPSINLGKNTEEDDLLMNREENREEKHPAFNRLFQPGFISVAIVDVAINQPFTFLTPHFLCRGPLLHGRYPLHHYYGLVRLPPVLLSGSPKFLTELSERAILLYPVVCRPAHSRSLLDSFWFQTLRHPDHTNWRHEA